MRIWSTSVRKICVIVSQLHRRTLTRFSDQPIGTGFSYGSDPVTSTVTAAPYVWTFLQAFYAQFTEYENRDFGLFTEVLSFQNFTHC